ncbi:hypothetical protein MIND_00600000 [Mycena indigotica]|uniref:Uncharacterized protein n=1 Tax=Mycena indigotica TaxID=2126181 RepID=A0A8H6W5M5_9AGAR|nr:uncharacterized protein MIND_00600000 [Mycena indigotica]KAF7303706.1 hypothetical protein MIND_00600000 [Mycena indigotica]
MQRSGAEYYIPSISSGLVFFAFTTTAFIPQESTHGVSYRTVSKCARNAPRGFHSRPIDMPRHLGLGPSLTWTRRSTPSN